MFHVALTRCRSSASIIPGSPPSPFLLELAQPGEPIGLAGTPEVTPRRVREDASGAVSVPRQTAAKAEMLAATVGARFSLGGHDHEVVELGTDEPSHPGGGPATTTVRFGTSVTLDGRSVVFAHPFFAEAWESLRSWRAERARAAGKPAFVVLDDKTLRLVAALLPTNEAGLLTISGIGPAKLENYGDELLEITDRFRVK